MCSGYLEAANGEEYVLGGDGESRTQHGFQVRLVPILSKTCHLPSTGHLNTWTQGTGEWNVGMGNVGWEGSAWYHTVMYMHVHLCTVLC